MNFQNSQHFFANQMMINCYENSRIRVKSRIFHLIHTKFLANIRIKSSEQLEFFSGICAERFREFWTGYPNVNLNVWARPKLAKSTFAELAKHLIIFN